MEKEFKKIIEEIGEDPNREGLVKTPQRASRAMSFLTQGYRQTLPEILNGAVFESDSDEMVIVKDIELYSMCEHHMLPFIGKCHVAYLPRGKVIGLSKVARIVDMYARRVESKHLCMMMRGVEKQNSTMTTSVMLGGFKKDINTRHEFLSLIR